MLNNDEVKDSQTTVTEAVLEYEGSITVDESTDAPDMFEYEKVQVLNLNGSRIETYIIKGERE